MAEVRYYISEWQVNALGRLAASCNVAQRVQGMEHFGKRSSLIS